MIGELSLMEEDCRKFRRLNHSNFRSSILYDIRLKTPSVYKKTKDFIEKLILNL